MISALRTRRNPAVENLVLRRQLAVCKKERRRPKLTHADRTFWTIVASVWPRWRGALSVVYPETVIHRHRKGFRWFWTRRCTKYGRPTIDPKTKALIREMYIANPLWGAPRNHGELLKLGLDVSEVSISRCMIRRPEPPSQTWRSFLENHAGELLAADFFTVPTAHIVCCSSWKSSTCAGSYAAIAEVFITNTTDRLHSTVFEESHPARQGTYRRTIKNALARARRGGPNSMVRRRCPTWQGTRR